MEDEDVKRVVKKSYARIASGGCSSCGCSDAQKISLSIGYAPDETSLVPEANLGLGCGNPTSLGEIRPGMTVLDLGSGAGFDCFLAAKKVGEHGRVIGVDMTQEMIAKAKDNAAKYGYRNVEFRLADIEDLPLADEEVDIVMSNCVINLAPDKAKVFGEAYRVLGKGGRLFLSDIVLLKELSPQDREDESLIAGCVAGALLKEEYLALIKGAGFSVQHLDEDRDISKRQYEGFPLISLKVVASK